MQTAAGNIWPERNERRRRPGEPAGRKERWEQVRQLHAGKVSITEIGRQLDIDCKTVRKMVREAAWRSYEREARADTLLVPHDAFLRRRTSQVNYSARILYQELQRDCGYKGSYETVKRFVMPLRAGGPGADLPAALRDRTRPTKPDRLEADAYLFTRPTGGTACLCPDIRLQPARLLSGVRQ